jgi:hypothetical protein
MLDVASSKHLEYTPCAAGVVWRRRWKNFLVMGAISYALNLEGFSRVFPSSYFKICWRLSAFPSLGSRPLQLLKKEAPILGRFQARGLRDFLEKIPQPGKFVFRASVAS